MSNFKQICKIRTDYNSKAPELELRQNDSGRFLCGKIQWFDGKDKEGKQAYTWFNFYTSKEELIERIMKNPSATFEVEGYLKNKNWQEKRSGQWRNICEIALTKVEIYSSQKEKPAQHFQEKEEEIAF